MRFKKVHSGGTSYPQTISQQDLTESGTSGSSYSGSTTNFLDRWSGSYIDESCGVAGEITYTLQCAEYDQSNHLNVGSGNMNGEWHIWFQEVKR